MKRYITFILFLTVTFFHSFGGSKIDSLYLKTIEGDPSDRIENLITLSNIYSDQNLDSCISVLKKAYDLSLKHEEEKWLPEIYQLMGAYYAEVGNYTFALKYSNYALNKVDEYEHPIQETAEIYNSIGSIYLKQSNFEKALEYYHLALENWKSTESKRIGSAYVNLGTVYYYLNDLKKAESYYLKAQDSFEDANNLRELANTYNHLGRLHQSQEDYNTARTFFNDAIEINLKINHPTGIANGYNNLAILYYYQEKVNLALSYFRKGLKIRKEKGDHLEIGESYFNLGSLYQFENLYQEAVLHFKEAYKFAQLGNSPKDQEDACFAVSENYYLLNKSDSAYKYLKLTLGFKDTVANKKYLALKEAVDYNENKNNFELSNVRKNSQFSQSEMSRDFDAKVNNYKKIIYYLGFFLALFFSLTIIFFLMFKKVKSNQKAFKQKNLSLQKEQKNHLELQKKYKQFVNSFSIFSNQTISSQQSLLSSFFIVDSEKQSQTNLYFGENLNFFKSHVGSGLDVGIQSVIHQHFKENKSSVDISKIDKQLAKTFANHTPLEFLEIRSNGDGLKGFGKYVTIYGIKSLQILEKLDCNQAVECNLNEQCDFFAVESFEFIPNGAPKPKYKLELLLNKIKDQISGHDKYTAMKILSESLSGVDKGEGKQMYLIFDQFKRKG